MNGVFVFKTLNLMSYCQRNRYRKVEVFKKFKRKFNQIYKLPKDFYIVIW